jgi:O-antigen ligase
MPQEILWLLILAALVCGTMLALRPIVAIYLEGMALPFQAVLIIQFGANIKISELLGVIVVIGWLVNLIWARHSSSGLNRRVTIASIWFISVIIFSLVKTFTNFDVLSSSSLQSVMGLTSGRQDPLTRSVITAAWAVFSLLNMFATASLIRDRRTLLRTLNFILCGSVFAASYAFYKLLFLNSRLFPEIWFPGDITTGWARGWVVNRSDGTFLEPSTMANYFIVMIPIALAGWLVQRRRKWAIILFVQLLGLTSSFSPGGWITFICSMLVFIPLAFATLGRPMKSALRTMLGAVLALTLVAFLVVSIAGFDVGPIVNNFVEKVANVDSGNTPDLRRANASSGTARIGLAEISIEMWIWNPILGVGIGNYPYLHPYYAELGGSGYQERVTVTPSVLYLLILSETGALGLMTLILFGGRLISELRLAARAAVDLHVKWVLLGLIGSFIGVAVNGLVLDNPFVVYYWFLAGVGLAAMRLAGLRVEPISASLTKMMKYRLPNGLVLPYKAKSPT